MSSKSSKPGPAQKGPVTYKLRNPIAWGEETITELVIQRPKGKQMRSVPSDIKAANLDVWLSMASQLAAQPPSVIDELDAEDAMEVVAIVAGFIGSSPGIGKTS